MLLPPPLAAELDTVPPEALIWPLRTYHAAGGIVVVDSRVLLLRRKNEIRLPKGHVEAGETAEACALREVREESGLRHPTVVQLLGAVRNRFAHAGHRYERTETWFLMTAQDTSMDPPEAQFSPKWHRLAGAPSALTYEAERIAIRWALQLVA